MNHKFIEAREHIAKAREALRHGDHVSARQLGERAALLAPDMEDAWLVLAASDPNPQEALAYAQKALAFKPESARARRGVEWASNRLKQTQASQARVATEGSSRSDALTSLPKKRAYQTAVAIPQLKPKGANWLYPALLIGAGCVAVSLVALFALTSPALASIVSSVSAPAPTQENHWAPAEIAKPAAAVTPIDVSAFAAPLAATPTRVPTSIPTDAPTLSPTEVPTDVPTVAPEATETPGTMAMEIIPDTPTSEYVAPVSSAPKMASGGNGVHWIDVDLTNQSVYAYEGDTIVNSFIVSTGTWIHPTVTGKYQIYIKLRSGNMRGPGYFLPDVPYIMYFYKSYGLHGTYWHHNFGTPMSHGCVNLRTDDAAWLYNWAPLGTTVKVHY
jgi:lipoprotein-anchoring transpeptidase ErfK/SrfK